MTIICWHFYEFHWQNAGYLPLLPFLFLSVLRNLKLKLTVFSTHEIRLPVNSCLIFELFFNALLLVVNFVHKRLDFFICFRCLIIFKMLCHKLYWLYKTFCQSFATTRLTPIAKIRTTKKIGNICAPNCHRFPASFATLII